MGNSQEAPQFTVGDAVRLKIGGPVMIVGEMDDKNAWCDWIDGKKPIRRMYPLVALVKAGPPEILVSDD